MKDLMLSLGGDLQFALFFGFLAIFLIIERVWQRRPMPRYSKRVATNFLVTASNVLVIPIIPVSIVGGAFWAESQNIGLINQVDHLLPLWALVVVTLLLRGFISFFTHFVNHKIPLLWRLHRVHHMDPELDVSTTVRFHPLEMFVSAAISVPLAIALGLPPWILLFYELFDVAVTLFSHANLRLPHGIERWLRYIITTPGLHTVHHSTEKEETDSNFSAVFPIWDVIFGTFKPGDEPPRKLGLNEVDAEYASRFGWLLLSPFKTTRVMDAKRPELGA